MEPASTNKGPLPRISELFKDAWQLLKARMRASLELTCIILALSFLSLVPLQGTIALVLSGVVIITRVIVGLAYIVLFLSEEPITATKSLKMSNRYLGGYLWISILAGIIIFSGSILFLIPGIWLAVIFHFSQSSLADMGYRGRMALAHSWYLVRGHWWKVFVLIISLVALVAAVMLTIALLLFFFLPEQSFKIYSGWLSTIIAPYAFALEVVVYRALKNIQGDIPSADREVFLKRINRMLIAGGIICLLLLAGAALALIKYGPDVKKMFNESQRLQKVDEKFLSEVSSGVNAQLPKMVDTDTRLDSTTSFDHTFVYNYTIVNYQKEDLDAEDLRNKLYPQIKNQVCTRPEVKFFREGGVLVDYNYYDKDGDLFLSMEVDTKTCP